MHLFKIDKLHCQFSSLPQHACRHMHKLRRPFVFDYLFFLHQNGNPVNSESAWTNLSSWLITDNGIYHLQALQRSSVSSNKAARAPISLGGHRAPRLPLCPVLAAPSVKRVNRVEERKLIPESEPIGAGRRARLAHTITPRDNSRLYPWAPGRNSHSLAMCGTPGVGGYRSIEASQINEPSINRATTNDSLFPLLSLCHSVCSPSLSLSARLARPPCQH